MPGREHPPQAPAPDFEQSILEYVAWAHEIDEAYTRNVAVERWKTLAPHVRHGLELEAARAYPNNPRGRELFIRATMIDGFVTEEVATTAQLEALFAVDLPSRGVDGGGEVGQLAA